MSGIEVAGLILGAIPLFVEACKAYKDNAAAAKQALRPANRDHQLHIFYQDFYFQTVLSKQQMHKIIDKLPLLSDERKRDIKTGRHINNWTQGTDVSRALSRFFDNTELLDAFYILSERLLELFDEVIAQGHSHLRKEEKNSEQMLKRLQSFVEEMRSPTVCPIWERFQFFRAEPSRRKSLKSLRVWNSDMSRFVDNACEATSARPFLQQHPSTQIRSLSRTLFSTLWRCWACKCTSPHQARLALENCNTFPSEIGLREDGLMFDFLVSRASAQGPTEWLGAKVSVTASLSSSNHTDRELSLFCDAMQGHSAKNSRLQFLIADRNADFKLLRLGSLARPDVRCTQKAVSFASLLKQKTPPLAKRRKMANILACSLLQLHESPWFSKQWDKEHVFFYYTEQGLLDLEHPFLDTLPEPSPVGAEAFDPGLSHQNPGILRLGILLLEIHKWQPIESMRTADDMVAGTPCVNTDLWAAIREVDSLEHECFKSYQQIVQACLVPGWVKTSARLSLTDEETWNAVFRDVVEPLGFEAKIAGLSSLELRTMMQNVHT